MNQERPSLNAMPFVTFSNFFELSRTYIGLLFSFTWIE